MAKSFGAESIGADGFAVRGPISAAPQSGCALIESGGNQLGWTARPALVAPLNAALNSTDYLSPNGWSPVPTVSSLAITTALGYTPANDANVIHTTGNETKTGNLTVTGSLIFDSTYEAVTAGMGGSNAHIGMTYRGTVKAGAFGSAASGFGAGQVALGTITGTSISPQAYILPNTNGVKVTQGDRTTLGTISASSVTTTTITTGSLIFDSTYEAVTSGVGGSNAHVGMTYRGVVKAGAFGSAANGFGAGQVALGTITGTSISAQAYLLPNTDGVKVTQGNRTALGAVYADSIQLDYDSSSVANFSQITHRGNFIVGGNVSSTAVRPVLSFYQGGATYGRIDVTSAGAFRFYTGSGGTTDAPISAGAATFSDNMTFSGSTPSINFTSTGRDTFIQHTAANTIQIGVNDAGRLQVGTAGVRLLDTGGDFGWSDGRLVWNSAGSISHQAYYATGTTWQTVWTSGNSASGAMIGVLGASAAARQTLPAAATDATTTQALCNAMRAALITFGFCN